MTKNQTTTMSDIHPMSFPGNPMTVFEWEKRKKESDKQLENLKIRHSKMTDFDWKIEEIDSAQGRVTPDFEFNDSITGSRF